MSECYCRSQLEGCQDLKKSDLVLKDFYEGFRGSEHTKKMLAVRTFFSTNHLYIFQQI